MSVPFGLGVGRAAVRAARRSDARPRPMRPVRTSSLIPCGRTSSSNASSSSGVPTDLEARARPGPTSATRASNTSASEISSARRSGGAATLISASSRSTASPGLELVDAQDVDELVHLLLDLLERVLRAVDAERDPRDVRALGRADGEALDVEAAPREHGRDPRERARLVLDEHGQRVAHGASPPRRSAVLDEVERGRARGDHREALLRGLDAAVDDGRAAGRERLARARVELVLGRRR